MQLFLDTANLDEIRDAMSKGVIQGVTTNPSLLSKEPKTNFYSHIGRIVDLCQSYCNGIPLSVEVFAEKPAEMISQAKDIVSRFKYPHLNIKIPIGFEELGVISELTKEGVNINCTCCFTTIQMELAALCGARYVSLFYCRLQDAGGTPDEVIVKVKNFIRDNKLACDIIAGSIRTPNDVERAWDSGADIVTTNYDVIKKSTSHNQTTESVKKFLDDFKDWRA